LTKHLLRELTIAPEKRNRDTIEVMMKASIQLPFFEALSVKKKYTEAHAHQKLCKRMIHVFEEKGRSIIRRSSFG